MVDLDWVVVVQGVEVWEPLRARLKGPEGRDLGARRLVLVWFLYARRRFLTEREHFMRGIRES